ncbi:MAG: glycosyltransferase family 4 protein [Myxococcota bacterium]
MTLVVHPHFHHRRSGATRHVEDMVRALNGRWHGVSIGRSLTADVPRASVSEILRRARREPVIWHAHRNSELLVGLLLRALAPRVKVVFTRHAGEAPGWYTRALASKADQVVTLTRVSAEMIRTPAAVVGHGVDLKRFAPPVDRVAAWRSLGLVGTHGLGVVGRIRPAKGQEDFVEAVAPLLPRHPEWHTALVGLVTPKFRPFAQGLGARLGSRLTFPGEQADILPWYQGLTVLVHPSYTEGYSLVLLEAMAAGCCVVTTRLPYTEGLVEHGRNGFTYAPGDLAALRSLLEPLLADPRRAEEIGRVAAADARERFGIEAEARRLGEIYGEVLGR